VVHAGAGSRAKLVATATLAAVVARVTRAASARAAVRRPAAGRGITAGTSTRSQRVHVVLHQGPADAEAVERLVASLDVPPPILRDPSLSLLAGVLSMASAYLGGDSGVSHLAAAVGAPSAIVFPAATRERWRPWSGTARAIAAELGDDAVATEAAATIRAMLDAAAAAAR
jgi:hypothetical protein